MKFILLAMVLATSSAYAEKCKKVSDCVDVISRMTGTKYLFEKGLFSDKEELNSELEFTQEHADTTLSEVLQIFNYARIPTDISGVMKIIPARDIRYNTLPGYTGSKGKIPEIPKNSDFIMFTYQGVPGSEMRNVARNLRPFVSRYGRVIDTNKNTLIIQDLSTTVRRVIPIIELQDRPLTSDERKQLELDRERDHQYALERMKHENHDEPLPAPSVPPKK